MQVRDAAKALLLLAVLVGVAERGGDAASSRQKRFIHFPYGSTLRIGLSSKWSTLFDWTGPPAFWTQGFNWGITYDLPNGTQLLAPAGLAGRRRGRRDLYRRLETAIDSTGLLGRPCILRAICEAPRALAPGDNVVAELLRVVLLYPLARSDAPGHYDRAREAGAKGLDCEDLYADCPFSVLGLLLSLRPSG